MALGQKYELGIYDRGEIAWIINFYKEGWTGDITTLRGGGSPIRFEFQNESDEVFDPIRPSQVAFSILTESNFVLDDLFSLELMSTYVEVFQDEESTGATPYWAGYVDPKQYSEPYDVPPYTIEVVCIDGLTLLQDFLFVYDESSYYEGRKTKAQVLLDVLGKIGFTEFKEYINIYDDRMSSSVDDSPLDQVSIDVEVFKDKYCNEVLEELLKPYSACIRQKDGVFCLYRPKDSIQTTVYGRYFVSASSKSSISYNPIQYINRTLSNPSALRQVPGGVRMWQNPAKKITINQDYGYKDSWIRNWQLKGLTYDNSGTPPWWFEEWSKSTASSMAPPGGYLPGETDGFVLACTTTAPATALYHYQTFAFNAIASDGVFLFSFDYLNYNIIATPYTLTFYISIKPDAANKWLYTYDDVESRWNTVLDYVEVTVEGVVTGNNGWQTFETKVSGIPTTGSYTIKVFTPYVTSNPNTCFTVFKNFRFVESSDELSIIRTPKPTWWQVLWFGKIGAKTRLAEKHPRVVNYKDVIEVATREYIGVNAIEGEELEGGCLLGDITDANIDNVLEQFLGVLTMMAEDTESVANYFVQRFASDYLAAGIIITADVDSLGEGVIFFEGEDDTVNWSDLAIANVSGDIDGDTHQIQSYTAPTAEVWTITLSGTSGTAQIVGNGAAAEASFNGSLGQTAEDFATDGDNIAAFAAVGVTLSFSGIDVILTSDPAANFSPNANILNTDGDLSGTPVETTPYAAGTVKIESIALSGTSGVANITCNALVREVGFYLLKTETWSTRKPGGEATEILDLIKDEITHQYSRPKLLIDMPIQETEEVVSTLNLLGCFVDDLNIDQSEFNIQEVGDWTGDRCSLAIVGGYVHFTSTGVDPTIYKSISLDGFISRVISIRYRVTALGSAGTPSTGQIYYETAGHARSGSYYKEFTLNDDGGWHILLLDMSDLTAGSTDWVDNDIITIWLDLVGNEGCEVDIDWIGFARMFVANRGEFDVRNRRWKLDLMEIIR